MKIVKFRWIIICLYIVVIVSACNRNSKIESNNNKQEVDISLEEENNSSSIKPQEIEENTVYVSVLFEDSLRSTHSYFQARKKSNYNLFYIAGKYKSIFTGGNEVDFLSEEELKNIIVDESNNIEISNRGKYREISKSYSEKVINDFIVSNAFPQKKYSDGINNLIIFEKSIYLNNEMFVYLLSLGFNEENIDTIYSESSSYFMDLKDAEVFLYQTNPDDYSFGKRGELVFNLKAID